MKQEAKRCESVMTPNVVCGNLLHLDCEEFALKGGECYIEVVSGYKYKK